MAQGSILASPAPTPESFQQIDDLFGKTPGWDFSRKVNQMKYAIKVGDRDGATRLAHEAEGLGDNMLSGIAAQRLEDFFNEIRRNLRLYSFSIYKAKCQAPIEDIKALMTENGHILTQVI